LSDICRISVMATEHGRQVSDKPQGRKLREVRLGGSVNTAYGYLKIGRWIWRCLPA